MKAYSAFAQVYDYLMEDVPYDHWAQALHQTIQGHCQAEGLSTGGYQVLEVGCGTGTFACRLDDLGYRVMASDMSESMLVFARQKISDLGKRIPLLCQDMRTLDMKPGTIHCVVSVCDGINYLQEEQDVADFLASAYRVLAPAGLLVLEFSSAYKLSTVIGDNTIAEVGEQVSFIWENSYDAEAQCLDSHLHLFIEAGLDPELSRMADDPGAVPCMHRVESHIQRAYDVEVIQGLLEQAGFERLSLLDSETFLPVHTETERLWWVARKPKRR